LTTNLKHRDLITNQGVNLFLKRLLESWQKGVKLSGRWLEKVFW